MNILEKTRKWLDKNKIEYEYSKDDIFEEIKIWNALNDYYWIRIYQKQENSRTIITQETFNIELYKPNGEAYQGDLSRRLSYKELLHRIENNILY